MIDSENNKIDIVKMWKGKMQNKIIVSDPNDILQKAEECNIDIPQDDESIEKTKENFKTKVDEIKNTILSSEVKSDFQAVENCIEDCLSNDVVPHEELKTMIEMYETSIQKLKVIDSYLDPQIFHIDFDEFEQFVENLNNMDQNLHCIPTEKIDKLNKLCNNGEKVKETLDTVDEDDVSKAKILMATLAENKFQFKKLRKFRDRLIIEHSLCNKTSNEILHASLHDCEVLFDEVKSDAKIFEGIDPKKAARALKTKLKLTKDKMEQMKTLVDLEEISKVAKDIRDKGLYTSDIDRYYHDFEACSEWYLITSKYIREELIDKHMSDVDSDMDFIKNYKVLKFFDSKELNKYLEKLPDVTEICYKNAQILVNNIRLCIWTKEYENMHKDKKDDEVLDPAELTALKELAQDFKIDPNECQELVILTQNYKINQVVKQFEQTGDEELLDNLLSYKSTIYRKFLHKINTDDSTEKSEIANRYITYGNVLEKIRIALEELKLGSNASPKKSRDNSDEVQEQYNKLVRVLEQADNNDVPENAHWYKYLRDSLVTFEKWQRTWQRYSRLKEKHKDNVHLVVIHKLDYLNDDKVKDSLLTPYDSLILKFNDVDVEIRNDLKQLAEWLDFVTKITNKFEDTKDIKEFEQEDVDTINA